MSITQYHSRLSSSFIRIIILTSFLALSGTVNSQNLLAESVLNRVSSKRLISKVELLAGASVIYPYGGSWLEHVRVAKLGFLGGAGLIHVFDSRWAINMKFGYGNKGEKLIIYNYSDPRFGPPGTTKGTFDFTLNYVTMSIVPRYYIFKQIKFYVGLGPYFGYLNSVKGYSDLFINGSLVAQSSWRQDPHLNYKEMDIGIESMLGYDIPINRVDCSIQFISSLGLIDITKQGNYPLRNNTFSLVLGFSTKK